MPRWMYRSGRIMTGVPRDLPSGTVTPLFTALEIAIHRMLQKDRNGRPRDGYEVIAALDASAVPSTSHAVRRGERLTREERRFVSVIVVSGPGRARSTSSASPTSSPSRKKRRPRLGHSRARTRCARR